MPLIFAPQRHPGRLRFIPPRRGGDASKPLVGLVTAASPNAQDALIYDDLRANGYRVIYLSSASSLPNTGYDVFVVTESGAGGSAAITSIPTCTLPVLLSETTAQTALMSATAATNPSSQTTVDITTAGNTHQITAPCADPFTTFSTAQGTFGCTTTDLAAGCTVLATHPVTTTNATIFVAEAGSSSTSGTFPARRVFWGLGIGSTSVNKWTAPVFDAHRRAIDWLATETLAPSGIDDAEAVGQATLSLSLAALSPAGIDDAEAVGFSSLIPGAVTVASITVGDTSAVGQTSLAQALAPTGIDGGAVGQSTLTQTLAPVGITGGNVGQSALTLTLAPFSIDGSSAPGQTSLTVTVAVNPVSVPRSDAVGYTILTPGAVTVSPAGVTDSSQVGQSVLTALGAPLNPVSIPTSAAVGNTTLSPGTVTISPAGIGSGQVVGSSVLGRFLVPLGVPSLAAVGQTQLEQFAPSTVFHLTAKPASSRYSGQPSSQLEATPSAQRYSVE